MNQIEDLVLDIACRLKALRTLSSTHRAGYMMSALAAEEIDLILETLDRHKKLWATDESNI